MDLTAPLIFVSIFVLASIFLFLVYKYGIKKKSYEEALAEHRKQTSAFLGSKPKPKEKKNKKAAKKVNKEKAPANSVPENYIPDETESVDSKDVTEIIENAKPQPPAKTGSSKGKGSSKLNKIHVEFKEEPEEAPVEEQAENEVKEVINKKRVKKVRPILIKKISEQEIILPAADLPVAGNHFEEIHPKDEFELLRAHSKDENNKAEASREEKKPEKPSKKNKQHKQDSHQQQVEKNGGAGEPTATEKEKPKEEKAIENVIAPLVQEPAVNTGKEKKKKKSEYNSRQQMTAERDQLIYSVRNAELSRTEVQLLIDLLLNKQLEAPAVLDDWSEGKFDPIQKLKKQLADKEKQLADEQDALVGAQAKLREVRNEQLADRALLQQKFRASEESKVEIIAAHNRLQQKIQELEDYRNKELANFQRVVEENKALQIQRGQLEATLMTYQESDALILNLKTENDHLNNELQLLTQERQEQVTNYQNCVIQNKTLQDELRATNEYVKGLERNHSFALNAHQEEARSIAEQLQRASETYLKEEQKLKDVISQLKAEKQKLQEENSVQINGSSDVNKQHEVKVLNLSNELSSVKSELSSVSQTLLDAERQHQTHLSTSQENYDQLKVELEEQKKKNNELRTKNWKVMEALNAAESRIKQASNKSEGVNDKLASEINVREQTAQKEFVQRLFPEIVSLNSVSSDDWQGEMERAIRQHISHLQKTATAPASPDKGAEVTKLQTEVQHYKKIIDETEGMLKKLESHIKQEEWKWRNELSQKDAEIQELKNQCVSQSTNTESRPDSNGIQFAYDCIEKSLPVIIDELQVKVSTLEGQLALEQAEKVRLLEEHHQSINRPEVKTVHANSTATIEKLSEEVDRLKEQLRIEQTKNSESAVYQNAQSHKSTIRPTYIEGETS